MRGAVLAGVVVAVVACQPGDEPMLGASGEEGAADRREPPAVATIALGGDAMLGRGVGRLLQQRPGFAIWRGLEEPLADVDVLAFNLETTITTHDEMWPGKNYHFKLDPAVADDALLSLPVPRERLRLSLANNHALDFHLPGLLDTLDSLDELQVAHAGAGRTLAEAQAPTIVQTEAGVRIGILAASTHCSCGDPAQWAAAEDAAGMWVVGEPPPQWPALTAAVESLRAEVDWVIVSLHWGPNWVDTWPLEWMRDLAGELALAGADVVFGHSAHHVLPVERIGDTLVLYGTGDLLDDYSPVDGFRNDLSFVARVTLPPSERPELRIVPLRIEHGDGHFVAPLPADHPDAAAVFAAAQVQPDAP